MRDGRVSRFNTMGMRLTALAALGICFNGFAQTLSPGMTSHIDPDSGDWKPSAAQVASAEDTAKKFMGALQSGRYSDAYALFTPRTRTHTNEKGFEQDRAQWTQRQGSSRSLLITDLTWSKNPKSATTPGVYVAVGLSGRYAEMDHYCGFLVLSQTSSGGPFLVNHLEETALDNKTAAQIARDKGAAYVEDTWKTLSSRCPGITSAAATSSTAEVSAEQSNLPFDSVADARAKLSARSGVSLAKSADGSESYADNATHTVWTFTPAGSYAYPAMIGRHLVTDAQGLSIKMSVLCEADKASCDRLVQQANAENQSNAARLRPGGNVGAGAAASSAPEPVQ